MPEPILAIDPGTFQTAAALVVGEQWRLVTAPGSGGTTWPPVRRSPDAAGAMAEVLAAVAAEARRRHGEPINRLVIAGDVPPPAADFSDVELIRPAVAALLDPAASPEFLPGDVVLVCDLGASWTVSLVRSAGDDSTVLATRGVAVQENGQVPGHSQVEARLRWLVESANAIVAETGAMPAGVVLAGGWTLHRGVLDYLGRALPGPLRAAPEPELAVLRGTVRWAAGAGRRRVSAQPSRWRVEPLSWRIPDRDARVTRWLVAEGTPFSAGAVIAQVRTSTDRVYELTAAADGAMLAHGAPAGTRTGSTLVAAVAPAVTTAAYDPPRHRHRWSATGGWLLAGQWLVEWERTGQYVHIRSPADGSVSVALRPDHGDAAPRWAQAFVDPIGRPCLLTWDRAGDAWVWDVPARALRCRLTGLGTVARLLVDERDWRLAAEVPDAVSKGRYRRTAVTFWDLTNGEPHARVVDDQWQRRHPGYLPRSAADRFDAESYSPDRRLRAVVGDGGVTLYETATERPVFRTPYPDPRRLRTAVSTDGRYLLAIEESDDRSTLDVWHL